MTKFTTASKRMLSMLLAVLMLFSGMAIASADSTETQTVEIAAAEENTIVLPAPQLTLNVKDKEIIVKAIDPVVVNGKSYPVDFSISPTAKKTLAPNGVDTLFYNLEMGKKYTVTATCDIDGNKITSSASETLKNSQSAPEIKAAKNVTSTSIEIPSVAGCEYMIEGPNVENPKWGEKVLFTDLVPDQLYTVSIRFKETTTAYASEPTKVTVRTLKTANPAKPAAPVLADKDMNSITVVENTNMLYSIDLVNWQPSGKFTGLKPGVTYSIYAMYAYDKTEQEPGPHSDPLAVKTNSRANSPASLNDCKITIEEKDIYYANETFDVTIQVKSTFVTHQAEYGDTIYIPVSYQVNDGPKITIPRVQGTKFVVAVDPLVKNANKTIKLTINFTKMKFVGGTQWIDIGEEVSSVHKVDIGYEYTFFNVLVEYFTKAFNLLFDTLPGLLAKFLQSDVVVDYFNIIFGLGDGSFGDIDLGGLLDKITGSIQ